MPSNASLISPLLKENFKCSAFARHLQLEQILDRRVSEISELLKA